MQRKIGNEVRIGRTVLPFDTTGQSSSIDRTEINITRYGSDKQLMPTFSPYKIYQYSDVTLKHLPEKALKKLEKRYIIAIRLFLTIS